MNNIALFSIAVLIQIKMLHVELVCVWCQWSWCELQIKLDDGIIIQELLYSWTTSCNIDSVSELNQHWTDLS